MNSYYIFFTDQEGRETLGGSHYDLEIICQIIESFIRINRERQYTFVSACTTNSSGHLEELVRWRSGSVCPIYDRRKEGFLAR